MTLLDAMAAQGRIALAEEATARLLAGIEAGDAAGRVAQAYHAALRRHGATILKNGGPEALETATDRLSAIPGREADRRAVLDQLWSDLEGRPNDWPGRRCPNSTVHFCADQGAYAVTRDEFDLREGAAFVITPGGLDSSPTLLGWTDGPASTLPPDVRRDIASGVRMAATAEGLQAELDTWRAQRDPAVWVRARMALLVERLAILERGPDGAPDERPEPRAPARTGCEIQAPAAVAQPGHPVSTQGRAREAVRALLNTGISNREIARRVGVSPSTVAAVQKAMAEVAAA